MIGRNEDTGRLSSEARSFLAKFKTLLMSTVSAEGVPEASYAPYVRKQDNCFYVYLSELAHHTSNLKVTGIVSVFFVEDERDTKQPFARRRFTFECRSESIPRDTAEWSQIMDVFSEKFGEVMDLIRPLSDFNLFRLRPKAGTYVKGFGQAYRVTGTELDHFEQIDTSGKS